MTGRRFWFRRSQIRRIQPKGRQFGCGVWYHRGVCSQSAGSARRVVIVDNSNPYLSPLVTAAPNRGTDPPAQGFVSAHERAKWTIVLLAIYVFMYLLFEGTEILELRQLFLEQQGIDVTEAAELNDTVQIVVTLALLLAYLATAVVYSFWIYRAYRNLAPLGQRYLRYSAGWAVGSYFVPILNLFRPFQIMKEIWHGSRPDASDRYMADPASRNAPWSIRLWWACWLASRLCDHASSGMANLANSAEEQTAALLFSIGTTPIELVASLLLIKVILGVDRNQTRRNELVSSSART